MDSLAAKRSKNSHNIKFKEDLSDRIGLDGRTPYEEFTKQIKNTEASRYVKGNSKKQSVLQVLQAMNRIGLTSRTKDNNFVTIQGILNAKLTEVSAKQTKFVTQKDSSGLVRQIVEKISTMVKGFERSAVIELKPEFLGKVKIKISMFENRISVQMVVENPQVKAILENQVNELRTQLQSFGLELKEFGIAYHERESEHGREKPARRFSIGGEAFDLNIANPVERTREGLLDVMA